MLQIAAACGVSRGALNHHFPSKELLLAAVLEERDRVNGDLFFTGSNPAEDGIDYFERLVRVVAHNASQREIVSLFATLSAEAADAAHPAHEYFVSRYRWLRADISDALRDIDSRGLLRTGVALEGLEADIVALIDGLQIQWLLDPTGVDMPGRLRLRIDELLASPLP